LPHQSARPINVPGLFRRYQEPGAGSVIEPCDCEIRIMHPDLKILANDVLRAAEAANVAVAAAESCTAGLLCQVLADAEGASTWFAGGFVTYTKEQKTAALGVPASLLAEKTAVCREAALAMAEGALKLSAAQAAAAITGVAGPEPDEDGNPVGRVCIGVARAGGPSRAFEQHYGALGRDTLRQRAVADALAALRDIVGAVSQVA
jgi:nicotinamide-nucleotide amidase